MGHDSQLRETESARLDSWKEIAAFLHRDARTVRRWERERGLPVHRVPGGERSGVFAYVRELESWLHAALPISDGVTPEATGSVDGDYPAEGIAGSSDTSDTIASLGDEGSSTSAASTVSAFHSLNTIDGTLVGEAAPTIASDARAKHFASNESHSVPAAILRPAAFRAVSDSHAYAAVRPRHYQAAALLLLLTAAIGISASVVHYRGHKPVNAVVHQPSAEAQDLYLQGRYYWNLRTEESLNCAVDLFTQSIVHDPKYAAAYAGLADSYLLLRQYGHMPNSEAFPRAYAAAQQAIALDDSSPEAHRSLAFSLRFWKWDMPAAEKEYLRAIALNPNNPQSHHWYATALLSSRRTQEALTQIDIARSLEPQSVSVLADRGLILSAIDVHAGVAALQQVMQAEPSFASTHRYLAGDYLQLEDYANFLAESRTAAELSHDAAGAAILTRAQRVLATQGPKPMLRELAASLAPLAERGAYPVYNTARLFGLAGASHEAIRYLQLSYDQRDPDFLNFESDPAFAQLRSSPEFTTLRGRRDAVFANNKQPIAQLDTPELSE